MPATLMGPIAWAMQRDKDGHRDYAIKWLIDADLTDGPATVFNTPGLPAIGSTWAFGGDIDSWAYCWPDWKAERNNDPNEPGRQWTLEQKFSTRPLRRCQDEAIENPLLEPPRVGGSFTRQTKEARKDRHGKILKTSSHEPIKGTQAEFDESRPSVDIELTLATLGLDVWSPMVDTVNDAPLWGLPARCIKLSTAKWQRLLYGTCNYYYTLALGFEINAATWDRKVPDSGSRCLMGWMPGSMISTPVDPDAIDGETGLANHLLVKYYEVYKDKLGENSRVFLDGKGRPVANPEDAVDIDIEYYEENNFLELGIPTSF